MIKNESDLVNGSCNGNGHVQECDLAITGASCRLPQSRNLLEFQENLINSIDMVTEDDSRFPAGIYDTPKRFGKIPDFKHFDAIFFQVVLFDIRDFIFLIRAK